MQPIGLNLAETT